MVQPVTADGAPDVFGPFATGGGAHYGGWKGASATVCGGRCVCVWVNLSTCPRDALNGGHACANTCSWPGLDLERFSSTATHAHWEAKARMPAL